MLFTQGPPLGAQEAVNPWIDTISAIRSDSAQVKQLRTLIRRPRRLRCAHLETYQTNSLIRWIQNSGKFPLYQGFRMIQDRLPQYEYNPDEVIRLLGEEGEDQETDQLDENTPLHPGLENQTGFTENELAEIEESTVEMFAAPTTLDFIDEMAARVWDTTRTRLTITSLTTSPRHNNDVHCSHMTGHAFDLRPLPGIQPRTFWWIKDKKIYDSKMNQALILDLLKQDAVKTVIFNDPAIHRAKEIKDAIAARAKTSNPVKFLALRTPTWSGGKKYPNTHHYHIHVELNVDTNVAELSRGLLKAVRPVVRPKPKPAVVATPTDSSTTQSQSQSSTQPPAEAPKPAPQTAKPPPSKG